MKPPVTARILLGTATVAAVIAFTLGGRAQGPAVAPRYEVAMIKWDGPDKIQLITPQKSETLRVFKSGATLPPEIHDEEFCLTWAANKLAQDGWEPVTLNSTRILLKRPVIR